MGRGEVEGEEWRRGLKRRWEAKEEWEETEGARGKERRGKGRMD